MFSKYTPCVHLLGGKPGVEDVTAFGGLQSEGGKMNTYHKTDQRRVSSKGHKYHEDAMHSDGEVWGDFNQGAPSGEVQGFPISMKSNLMETHRWRECLLHLRMQSCLLQEWAGPMR